MADKDDDFHDQILALADRYKLTGNERRKFIHEHMTNAGYRMEPTYVPADDNDEDEDEDGSAYFGKRRRSRGDRGRGRDEDEDGRGRRGKPGRQRGGADDWYP